MKRAGSRRLYTREVLTVATFRPMKSHTQQGKRSGDQIAFWAGGEGGAVAFRGNTVVNEKEAATTMMDFHSPHPVPSAARGSARRHRVEGGRHCVVRVRFNDAEFAAVEARAAESRVTVQRYLAGCALSRRPHPTATAVPSAVAAELTALRRLTANLANNINQIAGQLNSGGVPDASIDPALATVRRAMDRLDRALAAAGPREPGSTRSAGPPFRDNPGRSP